MSMGLKSSTGGYWNERREELRISQIKNWALCQRCRTLQKGTGTGTPEGVEGSRLDARSPNYEKTRISAEQGDLFRVFPQFLPCTLYQHCKNWLPLLVIM